MPVVAPMMTEGEPNPFSESDKNLTLLPMTRYKTSAGISSKKDLV
jgi:hypothetical protein